MFRSLPVPSAPRRGSPCRSAQIVINGYSLNCSGRVIELSLKNRASFQPLINLQAAEKLPHSSVRRSPPCKVTCPNLLLNPSQIPTLLYCVLSDDPHYASLQITDLLCGRVELDFIFRPASHSIIVLTSKCFMTMASVLYYNPLCPDHRPCIFPPTRVR